MDKGKRQRKKDNTGKRKRGVGIGIKIMGLLLLLAITAISCVGVLVWTLQSVIGMSDCNLLEYLTQRDIQTKNSGVNVRYRGKHRFFKGFNEFIKEKTRRCDNDFEKIERHVFF